MLGPYKERIEELLAENEQLPRKQRYTGHKIYQEICARGYQGSESTVRGYIAQRRREKRRPQGVHPPGVRSRHRCPGGLGRSAWPRSPVSAVTVQLFYMRLCYSRKLFMMAFPTQKQEAFFEGMCQASITFRAYRSASATTT